MFPTTSRPFRLLYTARFFQLFSGPRDPTRMPENVFPNNLPSVQGRLQLVEYRKTHSIYLRLPSHPQTKSPTFHIRRAWGRSKFQTQGTLNLAWRSRRSHGCDRRPTGRHINGSERPAGAQRNRMSMKQLF